MNFFMGANSLETVVNSLPWMRAFKVGFRVEGATNYTKGMDRVRFGRALGGGVRAAAKTLIKAADAAAAPNPVAKRAGEVVSRKVEQARASTAGVKRGGQRFGVAIWAPLAKQSGVLWLEFTGVFFGLFTLTAGAGVWKHRGDLLGSGAARQRVWFAFAMLVIFGYFTISSFVRARRRGRA